MAGAAPQIEWYVARDGQQYGPLSDLEMRKFVEFGHLRPTDLVWRHGFPDWRPAPVVFPTTVPPRPEPPRPAYQPHRQAHQAHQAQSRQGQAQGATTREESHYRPESAQSAQSARAATAPVAVSEAYEHDYGDEDDDFDDEFPAEKPRRGLRRLAAVTVLVALLGGALWLAMDLIPSPTRLVALIEAPRAPASQGGDEGSSGQEKDEAQPALRVETVAGGTDELDSEFQQSGLWQLLKREFPDWYDERLQEAARLRSEGRDRSEVARRLAEAVIALRRQHAEDALAASPVALKGIAQSFLSNLRYLAEESTQACYGFISKGETSPHVIELMSSPEHAEPLQQQATAVFQAVVEGRRSPQTHLPPRQSDYQELTQALANIGWTDREIQLFSNPRALASAPPEVVCKLVQDWFTAQLSVADEDVQLRLLYESLKPVVAG